MTELLISAVDREVPALFETMHLQSDAVLVNQCGRNGYEESGYGKYTVRVLYSAETGVGASRTLALSKAAQTYLLFSDEDIVYEDGYAERVEEAFAKYTKADMLLFNVLAVEGRRTYFNERFHRVRRYNCGRYPAYSIAARTDKLQKSGVTFSRLFGGGAKYSNGEDSLFLSDCLKAGLKIYAIPVLLGHEEAEGSSWFHGYTDKFFFDRGVLYAFLYGPLAGVLSLRFLIAHRDEMCREIPVMRAYHLMKDGIRRGREERRAEAAQKGEAKT